MKTQTPAPAGFIFPPCLFVLHALVTFPRRFCGVIFIYSVSVIFINIIIFIIIYIFIIINIIIIIIGFFGLSEKAFAFFGFLQKAFCFLFSKKALWFFGVFSKKLSVFLFSEKAQKYRKGIGEK